MTHHDFGIRATRVPRSTRGRRARWPAGLSVLTAFVTAAPLAAQRADPIRFEPCGTAARVVECARLVVRERPRDSTSRQLALRVVRIRQDPTTPATTATFFLAGGPGQAASEVARGNNGTFVAWAEHGDVVFIDQRGTEEGSPFRCSLAADDDPFTGIFPVELLSRCRDRAARDADLAAYGTREAAEDLELARATLGYTTLNLVGSSYGTRLAMEYLERFPDRVRAAVLDGVSPREMRAPLHYVADAEASLGRLSELCLADADCRRLGDPAAHFRSLMSRLAATPARVVLATQPSAPARQVTVGPEDVAYAVRGMLYGSTTVQLPRLLARADSTGDVSELARLYAQRAYAAETNSSTGLHLSVTCAEDVATLEPQHIREATAATISGTYLADQYVAACARWRVPARRSDSVTTRINRPLLLLSGAFDPVTPPRWAELVRARSTNARHVVFPYGGHGSPGPGMGGCKAQIVGDFLRTARPETLDVGCAAGATPPKFPPPA